MTFDAILAQVQALLQREQRLSYRALRRRFALEEADIEALKDELIYAKRLAVDEDDRVLVWVGDTGTAPVSASEALQSAMAQAEHQTERHLLHGLPAVVQSPPEAERRQLTVLFCDLVDSTRLARQLDPEDWRNVVQAYQQACAAVIQHFDGYIAQYLGDGLLVYFGYPQAHEDDAQRAGRASLGILEALGPLNARLEQDRGMRLAVRVGVHTGPVVVGAMGGGGRQEHLALGETPDIAARLQELAGPNTVVISAATLGLSEGFFTCQTLGEHTLKGVDVPMVVYQLLAESGAQTRLDAVASRGLTPLVGREQEVGLLLERWVQSTEGRGQAVLLRGEAGIGKSRLVEVLRQRVDRGEAIWLTFRCSPYHTHSVLYPIMTHLHRALQFQRDDTPVARLDRLEQTLRDTRLPLAEAVPLFATLLSVPFGDRYAPLSWSPQQQRQKTHEALVTWLVAAAERQPVLTVWEDLHWADPSTLDLLGLVLDQIPMTPMLTLLTCRPEFPPPWAPRSYLTQLTLSRLTRPQVEEMVRQVAGGTALPAEVIRQMVAKTDGVPLFVEELTKTVLEAGWLQEHEEHYELTGPLPSLAIPATLQDALRARLDRLADGKVVAQLGAVLGRTFAYELLRAVAPLGELLLWRGLVQLVQAEVLYQRGVLPHSTYTFKHALLQEAAYQSLLRSTRQQYHQRIAQVLAAQFPEITATQPELLAQHYTAAGLQVQALPYWHQAGQRAIARSAYAEAHHHLTTGLETLATVPETPMRQQHELDLLTALTVALSVTKGPAVPEQELVLTRAAVLGRQVGEPSQLFAVLQRLFWFRWSRAEFQAAQAVADQLLDLAQLQHDPALRLGAHHMMGWLLYQVGTFTPARTHLEQGIALSDPQRYSTLQTTPGGNRNEGVSCRAMMAWTLWMLGYPDQAVQWSQEALTLAQALAHPYSLANTLIVNVLFYYHCREWQIAQAYTEAFLALATEHGFGRYAAQGTLLLGTILAAQGQGTVGLSQMRQGLSALRATGSEGAMPIFLARLAEGYGQAGQVAEGLHLLTEALAVVNTTGGRHYEAELHRLQGELLLLQPVPDAPQAEACFHQALAVARRQEAKSLELRATLSLSRLWQCHGKRAAARELLAPIYGWFTEGFDTADLQDTRALLEELAVEGPQQ